MIMKQLLLVILIIVTGIFQSAATNDPNLKKGWEHFAKNEYRKAEIAFKKALEGSDKAEAHLAMSILGSATDNDEMATQHQFEFYKLSQKPEPYIEALWSIWQGEDVKTLLAFMNALSTSTDGTLQAKAHQMLGRYYRFTNKLPKSNEMYAKTGAVLQWQVLGEFENISESGFDKDFGALAHPEARYAFKNKWGADVYWFNIKGAGYSNWIDFETYFVGTNSVMYAQNFCNSPREQEVQFRIGTSGSVKVWVNDKLLFQESEERDNDIDTYVFTAKLMKGYNRILIQIGSSEVDDANFLLRITNSKGVPVEGLTYSVERKHYAQN
jgi:tetratricopeptide (TPR) repeat protein